MRKLVFVFVALVFVGCAYRANDLNFEVYKPHYKQDEVSHIEKILYIKSIIDIRENPYAMGTFEEKGRYYLVESKTDLRYWYYKSLRNAFEQKNYEITSKFSKYILGLKVYVYKARADFVEDFDAKNNMKGNLRLKVVYERFGKKVVKDVAIDHVGFYEMIPGKADYEQFLGRMLRASVDEIVKKVPEF